jgi:acetyltransferase-like isoleucine patch superfamily enzyme
VNVYIREDVRISNNAVIDANAIVTKDVPESAVVGAVSARII